MEKLVLSFTGRNINSLTLTQFGKTAVSDKQSLPAEFHFFYSTLQKHIGEEYIHKET